MNKTLKEIELDAKIALIRKKNEEILKRKQLIDEEIKSAEKQNAVVNPKKTSNDYTDSMGTLYADIITYVKTKHDEDAWRKERERIDNDRIQRQKAASGWKREWDAEKKFYEKKAKDFDNKDNFRSSRCSNATHNISHGDSDGRISNNNNSWNQKWYFAETDRRDDGHLDHGSRSFRGNVESFSPNSSQRHQMQMSKLKSDYEERDDDLYPKSPTFTRHFRRENAERTNSSYSNLLQKSNHSKSSLTKTITISNSGSVESKNVSYRLRENEKPKLKSAMIRTNFRSGHYNAEANHECFTSELGSLQDRLKNIVISVQNQNSKPASRVITIIDDDDKDPNSSEVEGSKSKTAANVLSDKFEDSIKTQTFCNSSSLQSNCFESSPFSFPSANGKSLVEIWKNSEASKAETFGKLTFKNNSQAEERCGMKKLAKHSEKKSVTVAVQEVDGALDDDEWEDIGEEWTDTSNEE